MYVYMEIYIAPYKNHTVVIYNKLLCLFKHRCNSYITYILKSIIIANLWRIGLLLMHFAHSFNWHAHFHDFYIGGAQPFWAKGRIVLF